MFSIHDRQIPGQAFFTYRRSLARGSRSRTARAIATRTGRPENPGAQPKAIHSGEYAGEFELLGLRPALRNVQIERGAGILRKQGPGFRLCAHRIGDRQVIQEGFVGPLARLVSHGGIGQVRRRAEAGRCGRVAEMIEDLPDDRRARADCDDFHRPTALRTEQRIDLVDLPNQARPRSVDLQGCSRAFSGYRFRPFGFAEETVLPAVTPCPIGVPTVEERGLLVGVRDVGTHLIQEVQGIEHPEVRR